MPRIPSRVTIILAAVFILTLALGCAKPDPRIIKGQGLRNITDLAVGEHPRDDGFLMLQITGRNTSSSASDFYYKLEWFDAQGLLLDSFQSRWKKVTVQGQVPFVFTEISSRPKAKTWRLMFKHDLK
ncbi:YcfL family protein [Desulfocurvibacter africanus]|uniref:YcfL family protein n=1 Tax=Desulfocurvibacter africanus TaxID=873 RepID=UPI001ED92F5D|nr:YcfL family protein [Desulfocurvibacter africanus]